MATPSPALQKNVYLGAITTCYDRLIIESTRHTLRRGRKKKRKEKYEVGSGRERGRTSSPPTEKKTKSDNETCTAAGLASRNLASRKPSAIATKEANAHITRTCPRDMPFVSRFTTRSLCNPKPTRRHSPAGNSKAGINQTAQRNLRARRTTSRSHDAVYDVSDWAWARTTSIQLSPKPLSSPHQQNASWERRQASRRPSFRCFSRACP